MSLSSCCYFPLFYVLLLFFSSCSCLSVRAALLIDFLFRLAFCLLVLVNVLRFLFCSGGRRRSDGRVESQCNTHIHTHAHTAHAPSCFVLALLKDQLFSCCWFYSLSPSSSRAPPEGRGRKSWMKFSSFMCVCFSPFEVNE